MRGLSDEARVRGDNEENGARERAVELDAPDQQRLPAGAEIQCVLAQNVNESRRGQIGGAA